MRCSTFSGSAPRHRPKESTTTLTVHYAATYTSNRVPLRTLMPALTLDPSVSSAYDKSPLASLKPESCSRLTQMSTILPYVENRSSRSCLFDVGFMFPTKIFAAPHGYRRVAGERTVQAAVAMRFVLNQAFLGHNMAYCVDCHFHGTVQHIGAERDTRWCEPETQESQKPEIHISWDDHQGLRQHPSVVLHAMSRVASFGILQGPSI